MKMLPDEAAIGVFDSGVGGLSVLRGIRQELPAEHLSYVADSANAPYGDRHVGFIEDRASIITEFLLMAGVKAIVVACNTITVVAIEKLRTWCPVPIVAMEPAIRPASSYSRSKIIGVLATSQTLASSNVARLCALHGNDVRILLQACPGLVEQVERTDLTSETTKSLLVRYISPLLEAGVDTIVLGCTHYLFLRQLIGEIAGPDISIVDSTAAVARELARRLGPNRKTSHCQIGHEQFFSSAPPEQARIAISALWGRPVIVHGLVPDSPVSFSRNALAGIQIS
jgi:glutamate racemase